MFRRTWRLALLLLVVALVLAACREGQDEAVPAEDETDETDEAAESDDDADEDDADEGDDAEEAARRGVTDEPCPDAVNPDNGCVYLGSLNDLTEGPFAQAGPIVQDAVETFWQRVNEDGGIAGHDIDASTYLRDNFYTPEAQTEAYADIREDVLGLAMSLGSSTTLAIVEDLEQDDMIAVPLAWNSDFPFESVIAESGSNYCVDSMNAVDFYVSQVGEVGSVMSVHYPNDYGQDADVGVRLAAEAHGAEFIGVPTPDGPENQADAIGRILSESPDLVVLTTNPTDAGALVGEAIAAGHEGLFIGHGPTWNVALLDSEAAPAFEAAYWHVGPYPTFDSDTPGHAAMREWLDVERGNDFHTAGWVSQYPVKAALEAAAANHDLTPTGVSAALQSLTSVDYEQMLPEGAGNFAGEPDDRVVRGSNIAEPDADSSAGISNLTTGFVGPTAEAHEFAQPCLFDY